MPTTGYRVFISQYILRLLICLICGLSVFNVSRGQTREGELRSSLQVLGSDAPYAFPEKAIVNSLGNIYVLDTRLSNIFFLDMEHGNISRLCEPGLPYRATDMSIDSAGGIWILSSSKGKIFKLNGSCEVQKVFAVSRPSLHLQVNAYGDIVVLALNGDFLFDRYSAGGKLLQSFGQRIKYADPVAESELSDGQLAADGAGGFFFSFNYPPLIQHYSRNGRLLGQFKPESDVNIAPPDISAKKTGNMLEVRARYQILVTDMAYDPRGRLILLLSGQDKYQALTEGSRHILVTTTGGRPLRKFSISEGAFHHLAAGAKTLYLLRNRNPLRLEKYSLP